MAISQVLQHLYTLENSSPEFLRALYTFIRLDEKGEYSLNLQQSESARLVNFLDGALDLIPVTDALFRRCLRRLRHICGHHNVLPSSHIISDGLRKSGDSPVAFGGFADVWEGSFAGEKVCVKVLRVYNANTNNQKGPLAPFYGEAVVWKRLRHVNVVPFLGVTTVPLQLVSKWMPNGTLTEYVNVRPHADRISLLLDVAEGVNYLHTCHMFHGDLKGPNILIDGQGHARVSDFGLASVAHGKYSTGIKSDKGHTVRWSAPEVLFGAVPASKQADIFAFGMVVIEAFTGNVPFHNVISTAVTYKLMNGERPPRPHGAETLGLSDALWKMTECCWQHPPKERLKASEVVDLLREMYVGSPSNSFIGTISGAQGLVGSGSTIPQTDAALSPRLLDILQYREPTHKRTQSDTTPLNDDRTVIGSVPERPVGAIDYQTLRHHPADGIVQRLGVADRGQNGQPFPSPVRSETPDTVEIDDWQTAQSEVWQTAPTIPHQGNLNQVPKPADITQDPPESTVAIPKRSIQTDSPITSDTSSFTVIDGFEHQRNTSGGVRTNLKVRDVGNSQRADGAGNDRGTVGSRSNRGDSGVRKIDDARKPGPPEQQAHTHNREPPALPFAKTNRDPAILSPKPTERAPSRSNSIKKKGSVGLGGLLGVLGLNGGGPKPPTRPATPASDRGNNTKAQERGGESRPSDVPPRQTGGTKKGPGGWGRVRVMTRVIGLHKRHQSQSNDAEE